MDEGYEPRHVLEISLREVEHVRTLTDTRTQKFYLCASLSGVELSKIFLTTFVSFGEAESP